MTAAMVLLVANVECEHTFRLQNRIKTNHRTGLSIDTLDKLMRVASGQDQIDFDMTKDLFLLKPRRAYCHQRIRIHTLD